MAGIEDCKELLGLQLNSELSPDHFVAWMKREEIPEDVAEKLDKYEKAREQFIACYTNKLREDSQHNVEHGTTQPPPKKKPQEDKDFSKNENKAYQPPLNELRRQLMVTPDPRNDYSQSSVDDFIEVNPAEAQSMSYSSPVNVGVSSSPDLISSRSQSNNTSNTCSFASCQSNCSPSTSDLSSCPSNSSSNSSSSSCPSNNSSNSSSSSCPSKSSSNSSSSSCPSKSSSNSSSSSCQSNSSSSTSDLSSIQKNSSSSSDSSSCQKISSFNSSDASSWRSDSSSICSDSSYQSNNSGHSNSTSCQSRNSSNSNGSVSCPSNSSESSGWVSCQSSNSLKSSGSVVCQNGNRSQSRFRQSDCSTRKTAATDLTFSGRNSAHAQRSNGRNVENGKSFQSPVAHSTPDKRRGNNRARPTLNFGDFVSEGQLAAQGKGQNGKKKNRSRNSKKQRPPQQNWRERSSSTCSRVLDCSLSRLKEFPSIRSAAANEDISSGLDFPALCRDVTQTDPVSSLEMRSMRRTPCFATPSDHIGIGPQQKGYARGTQKDEHTLSGEISPAIPALLRKNYWDPDKENRSAHHQSQNKETAEPQGHSNNGKQGSERKPRRVRLTSVTVDKTKGNLSSQQSETDDGNLSFCSLSEENGFAGPSEAGAAFNYTQSVDCSTSVNTIQVSDNGDQKIDPDERPLWYHVAFQDKGPVPEIMQKVRQDFDFVEPDPEKVTHKQQLDLLIQLHCACLDGHLFPNFCAELHFLFQLLIAQPNKKDTRPGDTKLEENIAETNFFYTMENTLYFALGVLERQSEFLKKLDDLVVEQLARNDRVARFSPNLQQEMKMELEKRKQTTKDLAGIGIQKDTDQEQIPCWEDQDSKEHFPEAESHIQFKKLRDSFNEVFRLHEEQAKKEQARKEQAKIELEEAKHDQVKKERIQNQQKREEREQKREFDKTFYMKIQTLFMNSDMAANLSFARLFVSQLVKSCRDEMLTTENYKGLSELIDMKNADPDNQQLPEGTEKPKSCGGPCTASEFTGNQKFFSDFIRVANSQRFSDLVSDLMISHIDELNEMKFGSYNITGAAVNDTGPVEENVAMHDTLASTLTTLRLLAKFLGYITFLPYHGAENLKPQMLQTVISRRSHQSELQLDVRKYVHQAVKSGRLAMTIPWVVEYLAMMDMVAPQLTPFYCLLEELRALLRVLRGEQKDCEFSYSRLLAVTSLEWFFEQPFMPSGFCVRDPEPLDYTKKAYDSFMFIAPEAEECKDLVTRDLFYSCCPYYGELRYLLTEYALGTRVKTEVRRVSPRPSECRSNSSSSTQDALLKNFCHQNMKSVHRVVEFVAEHVSSRFIKDIRLREIPAAIDDCVKQCCVESGVPEEAEKLYTKIKGPLFQDIKRRLKEHIEETLHLLLPSDTHEHKMDIAVFMANLLATRKVQRWMDLCLSYEMIFRQLLKEVEKKEEEIAKQGKGKTLSDPAPKGKITIVKPWDQRTEEEGSSTANQREADGATDAAEASDVESDDVDDLGSASVGNPEPVPAVSVGNPEPVPAVSVGNPEPVPAVSVSNPEPVPAVSVGNPEPVPAVSVGNPEPVPAVSVGNLEPVPGASVHDCEPENETASFREDVTDREPVVADREPVVADREPVVAACVNDHKPVPASSVSDSKPEDEAASFGKDVEDGRGDIDYEEEKDGENSLWVDHEPAAASCVNENEAASVGEDVEDGGGDGDYGDAEDSFWMKLRAMRRMQNCVSSQQEGDAVTQDQLNVLMTELVCATDKIKNNPSHLRSLIRDSFLGLIAAVVIFQPSLWLREDTTLFLKLCDYLRHDLNILMDLCDYVYLDEVSAATWESSLQLYCDLLRGLVSDYLVCKEKLLTYFRDHKNSQYHVKERNAILERLKEVMPVFNIPQEPLWD